jgi:hypothetical protein
MTIAILELNDQQITLTQGSKCWQSSGFATLNNDTITFGEKSQKQARLQPLVSFNQYWNQLSLDPIFNGNTKFRHYADFVYHQLLDLHQQANSCEKIILAVPSSFDSEQLSLLLGIFQSSPFKVIGIVNSALAATTAQATNGRYLYLDMQLHQCLITEIIADKQLRVGSVDIVVGTGLVNLYHNWAKYLAGQFIQQCRFDPLHDAISEQQLHDLLPQLLTSFGDEIQLALQTKQVKLNRQSLMRHSQSLFEPVIKALNHFGQVNTIFVSERIATLSALFPSINTQAPITTNAVAVNCINNHKHICTTEQTISHVTSLPINRDNAKTTSNTSTHVLCQNAAYPIGQNAIYINADTEISISNKPTQAQFSLSKTTDELVLNLLNSSQILINGKQGRNGESLNSGDSLRVANVSGSLTLINVIEGSNW